MRRIRGAVSLAQVLIIPLPSATMRVPAGLIYSLSAV
jgi:hypothetical protein